VADTQIKFQGDLGDDMQPPVTDDDDSQEELQQEQEDARFRASPTKEHGRVKLNALEPDTPQIMQIMGDYRRAAAIMTGDSSENPQRQRDAVHATKYEMMTFNELSDLEISQSQIQVDGQSEQERDHHSFG